MLTTEGFVAVLLVLVGGSGSLNGAMSQAKFELDQGKRCL